MQNDPTPSAIAAKQPRPAPRPIARVDVLDEVGAAAVDALGERPKALAADGSIEDVLVAVVVVELAFLKVVEAKSVGTGYIDPYIEAVAKTVGSSAVNVKSGMLQHVVLVRLTRPS